MHNDVGCILLILHQTLATNNIMLNCVIPINIGIENTNYYWLLFIECKYKHFDIFWSICHMKLIISHQAYILICI